MLKVTRLTMTRSRKAMIYTCIFSLTAVRSSCLHFIRFIIEVVIIFIHIPSCLYEIALKLLINIWPSFSKSFCSLSSSCLQHFDYIVHKDSRHLRKMSTSGQYTYYGGVGLWVLCLPSVLHKLYFYDVPFFSSLYNKVILPMA